MNGAMNRAAVLLKGISNCFNRVVMRTLCDESLTIVIVVQNTVALLEKRQFVFAFWEILYYMLH